MLHDDIRIPARTRRVIYLNGFAHGCFCGLAAMMLGAMVFWGLSAL